MFIKTYSVFRIKDYECIRLRGTLHLLGLWKNKNESTLRRLLFIHQPSFTGHSRTYQSIEDSCCTWDIPKSLNNLMLASYWCHSPKQESKGDDYALSWNHIYWVEQWAASHAPCQQRQGRRFSRLCCIGQKRWGKTINNGTVNILYLCTQWEFFISIGLCDVIAALKFMSAVQCKGQAYFINLTLFLFVLECKTFFFRYTLWLNLVVKNIRGQLDLRKYQCIYFKDGLHGSFFDCPLNVETQNILTALVMNPITSVTSSLKKTTIFHTSYKKRSRSISKLYQLNLMSSSYSSSCKVLFIFKQQHHNSFQYPGKPSGLIALCISM